MLDICHMTGSAEILEVRNLAEHLQRWDHSSSRALERL